jgi:hypothetical protein
MSGELLRIYVFSTIACSSISLRGARKIGAYDLPEVCTSSMTKRVYNILTRMQAQGVLESTGGTCFLSAVCAVADVI